MPLAVKTMKTTEGVVVLRICTLDVKMKVIHSEIEKGIRTNLR